MATRVIAVSGASPPSFRGIAESLAKPTRGEWSPSSAAGGILAAVGEEVAMPAWRLRDFHDDDLDQAIEIWDQSRLSEEPLPVFPVSEVMAAARARQPAVVAVVGDELVGVAVAQAQAERAWVILVALAARWRSRGIGSSLLTELERRLRALGVRRISAPMPEGATGSGAPGPDGGWPALLHTPLTCGQSRPRAVRRRVEMSVGSMIGCGYPPGVRASFQGRWTVRPGRSASSGTHRRT